MIVNTRSLQRLLLFFFIVPFLFSSCKKDLNEKTIAVSSENSIPVQPLNWETSDYMPTPNGTTILVPWASGSVKGFSSDIWYDYKKSDGWELVYNVFNTTSLQANPWFALYNRYRGILRLYVYVTTNGFATSSYITSGLNLSPNTIGSPLLNYIGQDIVTPGTSTAVANKVEPTQIASNTWYASEFEMAYDRNSGTETWQQVGMNWTLKWTNISQINLGGDVQGTVNGTITSPASNPDISGNVKSGLLYLTGLTVLNANAGPNSSAPEQHNHLGLPAFVFKAVKDGLSSGLQGVIKNIASGIFGGSSANTQQVSLNINAKITLNGTSTSNGAVFPDPGLGFGIPGLSNSQTATGYIPGYLRPMGIFNLTGKPTVNRTTSTTPGMVVGGVPYNHITSTYTVDNTIFNSLFVQNNGTNGVINSSSTGAALQNLRTQVVVINPTTSDFFLPNGSLETIGSLTVYTGTGVGISYDVEHRSYPINNNVAVRVIVDVVPNNGAPRSTIVKTFYANVVDK